MFENAFQFFSCYFYQDFSTEFGDPEIAVQKFIDDTDAPTRSAALNELRQLISELGGHDLERTVFELGCYYSPERHRGISMSAWIGEVVREIELSLSLKG